MGCGNGVLCGRADGCRIQQHDDGQDESLWHSAATRLVTGKRTGRDYCHCVHRQGDTSPSPESAICKEVIRSDSSLSLANDVPVSVLSHLRSIAESAPPA
jgi:hypothetical protein